MNVEIHIAAIKAAKFMLKHDPSVESWDDPVGWCEWYIRNGFLAALHDPDTGRITALSAARPVNCPEDGNTPYKYVEDGSCIFVDFLAIEDCNPLTLPAFVLEMVRRFGQRDKIAFHRVKVHDYDTFLRNASRITNVRNPYEPAKTTNPA